MKLLLYIGLMIFALMPLSTRTMAQVDDNTVTKDSTITRDGIIVQGDSIIADTNAVQKLIPKVAAKKSALLPGYGQVYNRKWWKVPIIYGIIGTLGYSIYWNSTQYKYFKDAYEGAVLTGNPNQLNLDRLRYLKNEFRRNKDRLIVISIVVYGLNIVDAVVDAHLSDFDDDNDISLKIKPQYERIGIGMQSQGLAGLGFVLYF